MGVLREGVGVYRGGASVAHHIFLGKLVNTESFRGSICNKKLEIPQWGNTMD